METYKPFSRDDQREVCWLVKITHQTDPPYPGLGHGTLAHLGGFLSEEEVELVIILFGAVWDEVCVDKCGICEEQEMEKKTRALDSFLFHAHLHRGFWIKI